MGASVRALRTVDGATDTEIGRHQRTVFVILWALAHLVHLFNQAGGADLSGAVWEPLTLLVLAATLLVLLRPTSAWRLAVLALAQLLHFGADLPGVANHWHIVAAVNAGLLAALVTARRRNREDVGNTALATLLPYARLALILAYGTAALAKLNTAFLDTAHSCAVSMYHDYTAIFAALGLGRPSIPEAVLPWGIAGAELVIAILLVVPRTRALGAVLAVVFHFWMAASPAILVFDFTFVLIAVAFLFLPPQAGAQLVDELRALRAERAWARWLFSRPVLWAVLAVVAAVAVQRDALLGEEGFTLVRWGSLLACGVLATVVFVVTAWRVRGEPVVGQTPARARGAVQLTLVALLVANALAPFAGGKTVGTFAMFSNLSTEQQESNHLLLPRLPVDTAQDDLVEIVEAEDEDLAELGEEGWLLSHHELRRHLADAPETSITYERDGEVVALDRAADDPGLVSLDPVRHRLIGHRPVDPDGPECSW